MSNRSFRDQSLPRISLFNIEKGRLRSSSSYSYNINEQDNKKAIDTLQDKVLFLKRLIGDIHDEAKSHNRFLDKMGNAMNATKGIMSRAMDRFKMVLHYFLNTQCVVKSEIENLVCWFYRYVRFGNYVQPTCICFVMKLKCEMRVMVSSREQKQVVGNLA